MTLSGHERLLLSSFLSGFLLCHLFDSPWFLSFLSLFIKYKFLPVSPISCILSLIALFYIISLGVKHFVLPRIKSAISVIIDLIDLINCFEWIDRLIG